jgi:multisubunit Na+/H+ antiporter MnhC subunit
MAMALLPLALVVLIAGFLPMTLQSSVGWKIVGAVVILIAILLLGVTIGLRTSATRDEHEAALDAAILATAGPCGSECGTGGCGVDDCAVKALPRN